MHYMDKIVALNDYLARNEKRVLLILTLSAFVVKCLFLFISYGDSVTLKWDDDWYYLSMGEKIAAGDWDPAVEGRPHMIVGPVIPMLIAFFIRLFGDPQLPLFLFNALATALVIPAVFYLGKEYFSAGTAWLAALWAFFFTEFFKYISHLLKEPLLFLLVPLTLLLLLRFIRNKFSFRLLLLSSLSYVLLIHADERYVVYLPVFIAAILFLNPLTLRAFLKPLSWFVVVVLLMLPWAIRNQNVFGQVVILTPRTTAITSHFWGSNLEAAASHFTDDSIMNVLNEGRYEKAMAFGNKYGIVPHEQGKLEARARALLNYWQPAYFRPVFIQYGFRPVKWSLAHNMAGLLFYGIFLPFYIAGMVILFRRRNYTGLFIGSIAVIHSLIHAYMVWPLERYRSPVTFIIVIIGLWCILGLPDHFQKRRSRYDIRNETE